MTPVHHAMSSAVKRGETDWRPYFGFHRWFDESKLHHSHFTHRCVRHHSAGVRELCERFAGHCGDLSGIGEQHVQEDHGRVVEIGEWMVGVNRPFPEMTVHPGCNTAALAKKFGGDPACYVDLLDWFHRVEHPVQKWHSMGIGEAENLFGASLQNGRMEKPLSMICEHIISSTYHRVPSVSDWARQVTPERWMHHACRSISRRLDQHYESTIAA